MLEFSLHSSGADTRAFDNSDMNAFMIAVEKGHMEVVKALIKKDPGLVSFSIGSGSTMIHWALEESHHRSDFFKVCFFIIFSVKAVSQFKSKSVTLVYTTLQ